MMHTTVIRTSNPTGNVIINGVIASEVAERNRKIAELEDLNLSLSRKNARMHRMVSDAFGVVLGDQQKHRNSPVRYALDFAVYLGDAVLNGCEALLWAVSDAATTCRQMSKRTADPDQRAKAEGWQC